MQRMVTRVWCDVVAHAKAALKCYYPARVECVAVKKICRSCGGVGAGRRSGQECVWFVLVLVAWFSLAQFRSGADSLAELA